MHSRKNIVLMFLIIMLAFAKVPEVSAISIDDAEPAESGLIGLFNPKSIAKDFKIFRI